MAPVVARGSPDLVVGRGGERGPGLFEQSQRPAATLLEEDQPPGEEGGRIIGLRDLRQMEPRPDGGDDPV